MLYLFFSLHVQLVDAVVAHQCFAHKQELVGLVHLFMQAHTNTHTHTHTHSKKHAHQVVLMRQHARLKDTGGGKRTPSIS